MANENVIDPEFDDSDLEEADCPTVKAATHPADDPHKSLTEAGDVEAQINSIVSQFDESCGNALKEGIDPLRKGVVEAEGIAEELDELSYFDCYLGDWNWNGWACPYFTKEVADQVMKLVNAANPVDIVHFDTANDKYIESYDNDEDPMEYEGCDVETDDGKKHLYPLGAWCWTWEEAEGGRPEEHPEDEFDDLEPGEIEHNNEINPDEQQGDEFVDDMDDDEFAEAFGKALKDKHDQKLTEADDSAVDEIEAAISGMDFSPVMKAKHNRTGAHNAKHGKAASLKPDSASINHDGSTMDEIETAISDMDFSTDAKESLNPDSAKKWYVYCDGEYVGDIDGATEDEAWSNAEIKYAEDIMRSEDGNSECLHVEPANNEDEWDNATDLSVDRTYTDDKLDEWYMEDMPAPTEDAELKECDAPVLDEEDITAEVQEEEHKLHESVKHQSRKAIVEAKEQGNWSDALTEDVLEEGPISFFKNVGNKIKNAATHTFNKIDNLSKSIGKGNFTAVGLYKISKGKAIAVGSPVTGDTITNASQMKTNLEAWDKTMRNDSSVSYAVIGTKNGELAPEKRTNLSSADYLMFSAFGKMDEKTSNSALDRLNNGINTADADEPKQQEAAFAGIKDKIGQFLLTNKDTEEYKAYYDKAEQIYETAKKTLTNAGLDAAGLAEWNTDAKAKELIDAYIKASAKLSSGGAGSEASEEGGHEERGEERRGAEGAGEERHEEAGEPAHECVRIVSGLASIKEKLGILESAAASARGIGADDVLLSYDVYKAKDDVDHKDGQYYITTKIGDVVFGTDGKAYIIGTTAATPKAENAFVSGYNYFLRLRA